MTIKKITLSLLSICSLPLLANTQTDDQNTWHDLSDPRAVYSSVSVAAGKEGVNLAATYGGYLNGLYKQKITIESMNDLDYYNADYLLVNANSNSGFSLETTWDRDDWGIKELDGVKDINDVSAGVFAKIPMMVMNSRLNVYPKLNLGLLWGDKVKSTTYIKLDATTRYSITDTVWVGISPTFTYAMQGYEINEWGGSVDAGMQLSSEFAFAAHFNTEDELWVDVIFTF